MRTQLSIGDSSQITNLSVKSIRSGPTAPAAAGKVPPQNVTQTQATPAHGSAQAEYLQVTSRLADLTWAPRSLCSVVGRLAGRPAPSAIRMAVFPAAAGWGAGDGSGGCPAVGSYRDLIRLATVVLEIGRTACSCTVRRGRICSVMLSQRSAPVRPAVPGTRRRIFPSHPISVTTTLTPTSLPPYPPLDDRW